MRFRAVDIPRLVLEVLRPNYSIRKDEDSEGNIVFSMSFLYQYILCLVYTFVIYWRGFDELRAREYMVASTLPIKGNMENVLNKLFEQYGSDIEVNTVVTDNLWFYDEVVYPDDPVWFYQNEDDAEFYASYNGTSETIISTSARAPYILSEVGDNFEIECRWPNPNYTNTFGTIGLQKPNDPNTGLDMWSTFGPGSPTGTPYYEKSLWIGMGNSNNALRVLYLTDILPASYFADWHTYKVVLAEGRMVDLYVDGSFTKRVYVDIQDAYRFEINSIGRARIYNGSGAEVDIKRVSIHSNYSGDLSIDDLANYPTSMNVEQVKDSTTASYAIYNGTNAETNLGVDYDFYQAGDEIEYRVRYPELPATNIASVAYGTMGARKDTSLYYSVLGVNSLFQMQGSFGEVQQPTTNNRALSTRKTIDYWKSWHKIRLVWVDSTTIETYIDDVYDLRMTIPDLKMRINNLAHAWPFGAQLARFHMSYLRFHNIEKGDFYSDDLAALPGSVNVERYEESSGLPVFVGQERDATSMVQVIAPEDLLNNPQDYSDLVAYVETFIAYGIRYQIIARPYLRLSPTTMSFDSWGRLTDPDSNTIILSTNSEWMVNELPPYVNLSRINGIADAVIEVFTNANTSSAERSDTIVFQSSFGVTADFSITQEARTKIRIWGLVRKNAVDGILLDGATVTVSYENATGDDPAAPPQSTTTANGGLYDMDLDVTQAQWEAVQNRFLVTYSLEGYHNNTYQITAPLPTFASTLTTGLNIDMILNEILTRKIITFSINNAESQRQLHNAPRGLGTQLDVVFSDGYSGTSTSTNYYISLRYDKPQPDEAMTVDVTISRPNFESLIINNIEIPFGDYARPPDFVSITPKQPTGEIVEIYAAVDGSLFTNFGENILYAGTVISGALNSAEQIRVGTPGVYGQVIDFSTNGIGACKILSTLPTNSSVITGDLIMRVQKYE